MLYLISEEANRDLDEITDYFLNVSVDAGDRFVTSFDERCLYLTQFPHIGKRYPDLGNNLRGIRLGRYTVFYRVFPDRLVIARVLNASRDLKGIFSS
jgi:toxin ParE1/3/4